MNKRESDTGNWGEASAGFTSNNVPIVTRALHSEDKGVRSYAQNLLIQLRTINAKRELSGAAFTLTNTAPPTLDYTIKHVKDSLSIEHSSFED